MQIRLGYELIYNFPQPTPMILALSIHYSRTSDLIIPDYLTTDPPVPIRRISRCKAGRHSNGQGETLGSRGRHVQARPSL
jgi:hypothetical protein